MPIFDHYAEYGGDIGFELHPCEDLFDAATWKTFLDRENGHKSAMINYDPSHFLLQQMDYLAFSDLYHDRIKAFHVKDAEFNPDGRQGGVLSLPEQDRSSWAVLEWECCIKPAEQGAAEGAPFIAKHLIESPRHAFDDFVGSERDNAQLKRMLGL